MAPSPNTYTLAAKDIEQVFFLKLGFIIPYHIQIRLYQSKKEDSSFMHFLKDHRRQPPSLDEGKSILHRSWGEILYHLHNVIKKARYNIIPKSKDIKLFHSLSDNYAVHRLKETIVKQIAVKVLFEETTKLVEKEMKDMDRRKRIDNPPKQIGMETLLSKHNSI